MIATADGGYESASDYDEETLALITREEHGGDDSDHETQYMAPEDADRYECLVAQRVLSVQVTQAEQNQRHNLFHTKGVVKEHSIHVIIDGGSCNNLASVEMVEKLSLTTRPHLMRTSIQLLHPQPLLLYILDQLRELVHAN